MKRPVWFRRHGLHWTPCTWQGWSCVGAFTLLLLYVVFAWAPVAPRAATAATLAAVVGLLGVAVLTDDSHQSAP